MFSSLVLVAALSSFVPSQPAVGGERCRALEACGVRGDGLVVHEWGTFTSVQGSDGIVLEGLQHEEEDLPAFVYSRSEVRDCPLRARGYKGLEVDVAHVTKKMETPVIYFHAPHAQRVRLRVDFQGGLLSQWFPVSDLLGPPEKSADEGPLDVREVGRSFLEWEVDVLEPGEKAAIPAVDAGTPWAWQRSPAANFVRTVPRQSPRTGPVEAEKFLFYRGVGSFELPLEARTEKGSRLVLTNRGRTDIPSLCVLHVRGGRGEFTWVNGLGAGKTVEVARQVADGAQSVEKMVGELVPSLVVKLVERGLYPDEATAMARTWERSYFRTEGLRVLYVVPDEQTSAILPLAMTPAPQSLVRVLVGRLECIGPEQETLVRQALLDRKSDDAALRASAAATLDGLGRFLEPNLRLAIRTSQDARLRASAEELLAGL